MRGALCDRGVFPLTGYLSWLGEYKKKGSELKVDPINEAGGVNGRPLKMIVYDDQYSPEQAEKNAQRLLSKDNAIAIIGTASVPISGAVASLANKYSIPAIIGSGYEVDPKKDRFVFNSARKTDFAVARPFSYFLEKDIKRGALPMPSNPLGDTGSWLGRHLSFEFGI
ncbi:MAG: ABC transporter substrate-binding protein [Syntrophorhabdaceae bacterium]|nr:ABC transporter substrate-binding protein [Syntrophorhabdaceae bacterium]